MSAKIRAEKLRQACLHLLLKHPLPAAVRSFGLNEARDFKDRCEQLQKGKSYSKIRLQAEYFAPLYGVRIDELDPEVGA